MGDVLDGEVTPAQLGAILMALRMRGETVDELTGFVSAMRARVIAVQSPEGTIDTCGTGGDLHATFNISTAAALVVSAAGVPVAKHGNRAVTSRSGSSDVMGALGLTVEQSPEDAAASLDEAGFCFLHAPSFHPGMRHASPTRRELGIRTAFNLCGPLANPAFPRRQLVGVADPEVGAAGRRRAPRAGGGAGVRRVRRARRRAAARRHRRRVRRPPGRRDKAPGPSRGRGAALGRDRRAGRRRSGA